METVDRRVHKTKKALKDALLQLMEAQEFKSITITDIVHLADLNRGTFYKHYTYKEDLLDDIVLDVITDLIESFRAPYRHNAKFFEETLSASAIKIFDHVEKHAAFYTMIINSNGLPGFQNRICNVLIDLTMHDIRVDVDDPVIDRQILASYTGYSLFGMIVEWVKGGFQHSSSYMAEQLTAILSYQKKSILI